MPNPVGKNQLGSPPAYGQIKKMLTLERSAPLAGNQKSALPLGAPKTAQRKAVGGARVVAAAPPPAPAPVAPPQNNVPAAVQVAMIWRAAADDPGSSPLVKQMAAQAEQEAGIG